MATQVTYLRYKREQRCILYWMTNTAAEICKRFHVESSIPTGPTGVVSLETLKSLSAFIAEHMDPIPPTIFQIFDSIICARKRTRTSI
jgi:hypothetical protein